MVGGVAFGVLSALFPRLGLALMRAIDVMMAFPALLLALALIVVLGRGVENSIIAIGVVYLTTTARIAYGASLRLNAEPWVEAARGMGAGTLRIAFRHILPNLLSPLFVQASFVFAFAQLQAASLDFLGLGVPPETPTWGNMLSESRVYITRAPWLLLFPGLMIADQRVLAEPGRRRAPGPAGPPPQGGILEREQAASMKPLLSIRDLTLEASAEGRRRAVVDGISLSASEGETLALVGESGSGKSMTGLAIMGLLPEPGVRVAGGRIEFAGTDLLAMTPRARRAITGRAVAMVFQEPMTSLNPVMRVGDQIAEMIRAHERVSGRAARDRAADLLRAVRMPQPAARLRAWPHQLSGGQRQRVLIAIALACRPRLLIADEPTTALDVTVQARILALLRDLQAELRMAMLFITHDLGVVANVADRVAVMYCGRILERGAARDIFARPSHPYTRGLLDCIPDLRRRDGDLTAIPGQAPAPNEVLAACRFAPRCPLADDDCARVPPPAVAFGAGHVAQCHRPGPAGAG